MTRLELLEASVEEQKDKTISFKKTVATDKKFLKRKIEDTEDIIEADIEAFQSRLSVNQNIDDAAIQAFIAIEKRKDYLKRKIKDEEKLWAEETQ